MQKFNVSILVKKKIPVRHEGLLGQGRDDAAKSQQRLVDGQPFLPALAGRVDGSHSLAAGQVDEVDAALSPDFVRLAVHFFVVT